MYKSKDIYHVGLILMRMGVTPDLNGYGYLIEAVSYVMEQKAKPLLTVDVFPYVAEKFGTTKHYVDRCVRYVTRVINYIQTDMTVNIFPQFAEDKLFQLTNAKLIFGLADFINNALEG